MICTLPGHGHDILTLGKSSIKWRPLLLSINSKNKHTNYAHVGKPNICFVNKQFLLTHALVFVYAKKSGFSHNDTQTFKQMHQHWHFDQLINFIIRFLYKLPMLRVYDMVHFDNDI